MRQRTAGKKERSNTTKIRISVHGGPGPLIGSLNRQLVYVSILLIPFITSSRFTHASTFPKYAFFLLLCVATGLLFTYRALIEKKSTFVQSPVIHAALMLLFGFVLSSIFSLNPLTSLTGTYGSWTLSLAVIAATVALTIITANTVHTIGHVHTVLRAIAVSGIFVALAALWELYRSGTIPDYLFEDGSQMSGFLMVTSASTVILLGVTRKTLSRIAGVLTLIVHVTVIVWVLPNLVRIPSWNSLIDMTVQFLERPLFGTGPEMLSAIPVLSEQSAVMSDPKNLFSAILLSTGIAGIVPLLFIVAHTVSSLVRSYSTKQRPSQYTTALRGILIITAVWFIAGTLSLPSIPMFLMLALLLGSLSARSPSGTIVRHSARRPVFLTGFAPALIAMLIVLSITGYMRADIRYTTSFSQNTADAVAAVQRAVELEPYEPAYHRRKAEVLVQFLSENPSHGNRQNTLETIRRTVALSIALNPYDWRNYQSAADVLEHLYELYQEPSYLLEAISYSTLAIQHNPHNIDLYLARGSIFTLAQRYDSALKDYLYIIEAAEDLWPVYFAAADTAVMAHDEDTAQRLLKIVIEECGNENFAKAARQRLEGM